MGHKSKKKKKKSAGGDSTVELNLMPFIDIFSLLTTFLLFSAVFVQIGILEVQVPFLSNAAQPDDEKPSRTIVVNVDVQKEKLAIETSWSAPPEDQQKHEYSHDEQGILEMHNKLVELRIENAETDKVTLFADDDVPYEQVSKILDAVKLLREGDPPVPNSDTASPDQDDRMSKIYLYKKVVMGSVML